MCLLPVASVQAPVHEVREAGCEGRGKDAGEHDHLKHRSAFLEEASLSPSPA